MKLAEASVAGVACDPMAMAKKLVQSSPYTLSHNSTNAWEIGEGVKADCISISRYGNKVFKILGIPGTYSSGIIYAKKSTGPTNTIFKEFPPTHGGLNTDDDPNPPDHPDWNGLALIDGNGGANAFEAVAKLTYNGVSKIFPAGANGEYNADQAGYDLLLKTIFKSMNWVATEPDPNDPSKKITVIKDLIHTYH